MRVRLTDRIAAAQSYTARLDKIAAEVEQVDPRLALALDMISDQLEGREAAEKMDVHVKTEEVPEKLKAFVDWCEKIIDEHLKAGKIKFRYENILNLSRPEVSGYVGKFNIEIPKHFIEYLCDYDLNLTLQKLVYDQSSGMVEGIKTLNSRYKEQGWVFALARVNDTSWYDRYSDLSFSLGAPASLKLASIRPEKVPSLMKAIKEHIDGARE